MIIIVVIIIISVIAASIVVTHCCCRWSTVILTYWRLTTNVHLRSPVWQKVFDWRAIVYGSSMINSTMSPRRLSCAELDDIQALATREAMSFDSTSILAQHEFDMTCKEVLHNPVTVSTGDPDTASPPSRLPISECDAQPPEPEATADIEKSKYETSLETAMAMGAFSLKNGVCRRVVAEGQNGLMSSSEPSTSVWASASQNNGSSERSGRHVNSSDYAQARTTRKHSPKSKKSLGRITLS